MRSAATLISSRDDMYALASATSLLDGSPLDSVSITSIKAMMKLRSLLISSCFVWSANSYVSTTWVRALPAALSFW